MRHFPIYLDLNDQRVIVAGAGETAAAKLRLLIKTSADIHVFGTDAAESVAALAERGAIRLHARKIRKADLTGARLFYAANGDDAQDAVMVERARKSGVLCNSVDNLNGSDFITPAIVDRDPVTVAIGTEGTAPVLARRIKADIEQALPARLGQLARLASGLRARVETSLPPGRLRRVLWNRFFEHGDAVLAANGDAGAERYFDDTLDGLAQDNAAPGRVDLIGAGPGDPTLLTLKARTLLHEADVVLYDRLVDPRVLELARREALLIETGKSAGQRSWQQSDINAAMIEHAEAGHHVVRLKSGDPLIFGRADEEMDALEAAGVAFAVVPGITSAVAAAAQARVSLTRRGRNSELRFITAHDADGFTEHEWKGLAHGRTAIAVYMGVKASRFIQGRLLLHGADPVMPVTVIERISRNDEKRIDADLSNFPSEMASAGIKGPAILLIGLQARSAKQRTTTGPQAIPETAPLPAVKDPVAAVWAF